MKHIVKLALIAVVVILGFTACNDDELDPNSIFTDEATDPNNVFDQWLVKNYVNPYNVELNWRYNDSETNNSYNVVPCDSDKAVALAIMIKHMWFDAYSQLIGEDFLKTNSPRVLQLIGSLMYSSNESVVLGYAENGIKVNLFNVNAIDIDDPYIDTDSWAYDGSTTRSELNHWFFHVMHHEFCHILNQKKNYNTDFDLVSVADYRSGDWINVDDSEAPLQGFVSGYASSEAREDFAEIYSLYITISESAWENLLAAGTDGDDTTGTDAIEEKLEYVRDYMKGSWGIDIDELRQIILRRSSKITELDLRSLE